jgi:hypothetical protein
MYCVSRATGENSPNQQDIGMGKRQATNPPSADDVDRSTVARGGQSAPAATTLAVLHHYTGDAAGLAS